MRRARVWRAVTGACLLAGYAGYYVCRSNLSVSGPLLWLQQVKEYVHAH